MTVSEKNVQIEKTSEQGSNRRTFIKKASAGIVLTSLPAQSVWGATCTVSGAMSGNLSGIARHNDCQAPSLVGPSADWWKDINDGSSTAVAEMFSNVLDDSAANAICLIEEIKNVVSSSMTLNMDIYPAGSINIASALGTSGTLEYNLAAVWLNSYFGFDGQQSVGSASQVANAKVNEVLAYIVVQTAPGMAINSSSSLSQFFMFAGGVSDHAVSDTCIV